MPYRFTHGETFQDALIRIGIEQFDRARTTLKHDAADKAIHETRKCIKRLRALLRLVRSGIDDAAFEKENRRLRDISRSLSGARDRTVLLATITRLAAGHPEVRQLQAALQAGVLAPSPEASPSTPHTSLDETIDELGEARLAWKTLTLEHDAYAPIGEGLAKGLRDLQEASAAAGDGNDDDAAHDWRKATQRHWRHMRLLEAGWPAYFQVRALEAKAVSDLLGNAQDLALLVRWIDKLPASHLSKAKAHAVIKLAREEQASLRAEALLRTQRLAAERPQAHARKAEQFWNAAAGLPSHTMANAAQKAKTSSRKQSAMSAAKKKARTKPPTGGRKATRARK
jgi:hypothetical protein